MSEIYVKENESLDNALKRFKRSCAKSGVLADLRKKINGKLNDAEPNDIIDAARYVLYYNYHAAPQTIFKREVSKNHE